MNRNLKILKSLSLLPLLDSSAVMQDLGGTQRATKISKCSWSNSGPDLVYSHRVLWVKVGLLQGSGWLAQGHQAASSSHFSLHKMGSDFSPSSSPTSSFMMLPVLPAWQPILILLQNTADSDFCALTSGRKWWATSIFQLWIPWI